MCVKTCSFIKEEMEEAHYYVFTLLSFIIIIIIIDFLSVQSVIFIETTFSISKILAFDLTLQKNFLYLAADGNYLHMHGSGQVHGWTNTQEKQYLGLWLLVQSCNVEILCGSISICSWDFHEACLYSYIIFQFTQVIVTNVYIIASLSPDPGADWDIHPKFQHIPELPLWWSVLGRLNSSLLLRTLATFQGMYLWGESLSVLE